MTPRKDWLNCDLCGRNTLARHAYHMYVKRCKKVKKSAEFVSSQLSWFAVNEIPHGYTEDVRIPLEEAVRRCVNLWWCQVPWRNFGYLCLHPVCRDLFEVGSR